MNKTNDVGAVRVKTRNDTATAGEDYKPKNEVLEFTKKDASKTVKIEIIDDEGWEPDEDFFVDLLEVEGDGIQLEGADTSTRVTIIDDDKPGSIGFEQTKGNVLAVANTGKAEIVLVRKNGSDGIITVEYETFQIDESEQTATPDVDYKEKKGTATFADKETI